MQKPYFKEDCCFLEEINEKSGPRCGIVSVPFWLERKEGNIYIERTCVFSI